MRFWDSSAVVPMLAGERAADACLSEYERDPEIIASWATVVECASALARLEREESLDAGSHAAALRRLDSLAGACAEVQPAALVRSRSLRVLRLHPLRAADSLQLAAALVAAEDHPESLRFVTLDDRLAGAAEREGFTVVKPG
jgi:uncharacterized protein